MSPISSALKRRPNSDRVVQDDDLAAAAVAAVSGTHIPAQDVVATGADAITQSVSAAQAAAARPDDKAGHQGPVSAIVWELSTGSCGVGFARNRPIGLYDTLEAAMLAAQDNFDWYTEIIADAEPGEVQPLTDGLTWLRVQLYLGEPGQKLRGRVGDPVLMAAHSATSAFHINAVLVRSAP